MKRVILIMIATAFILAVMYLPQGRVDLLSERQCFDKSTGSLVQVAAADTTRELYAAKEKDKEKEKKEKEKKKPKSDPGTTIPGAPMAAAVLIGLGSIGAVVYFLARKKK